MAFKPFPRQQIAIDKMVNFVNSKTSKKGIFVYPVAFGKSIVIAHVAQKFPDKYFINICPNKELTLQNKNRYCSYGYEASICSASLGKNELSQVIFGTIGTLKKHVEFFKDKDVIILNDECFTYDTPIATKAEGVEKIGNIVKYFNKGKNFEVKSYNEITKSFEYKKVLNVFERGVREVYKTSFYNDFSIESTINHRLLTLEGWKEVGDLKTGDAIISSFSQDHNSSYLHLNEDQRAIIIGSSLGDGNLDVRAKDSNTARIRMVQGLAQKDYLYWKASMLYKEDKVEEVLENGFSKKTAYRFNSNSFYFKEEYKTYEWQINNLCYKSLAILWMDDGCKDTFSNSGRLYSMADSKKYCELLKEKLEDMGYKDLKVRKSLSSSTKKEYYFIAFNKKDFLQLCINIAPYIREEFKYKMHSKVTDINTYKWDNKEGTTVKIFKNTEYIGKEKTYDIEVEDNHNFVVTSPSSFRTRRLRTEDKRKVKCEGIVAHNCQNSALKGSQLDKFIKGIKKCKVIGTTGTPVRLDSGLEGSELKMMNRMRKCFYSSIEDVVQIHEVIAEGRWSKLLYEVENVDDRFLELNSTGTEYTIKSLKEFSEANNIIDKAEQAIKRLVEEGRKSILVYMPFIEDAEKLERRLNNGIAVHSKTSSVVRDRAVESFKKGDLQVLINCLIYVEGFDYPELSAIVQCRPTNSINQWYQSLGRGTRIHPNKEDCKIVDLSGNFNKFGKIEGLTFEDIPYYGWGMWNSNNELLTNFPLKAKHRPTKGSLMEKGKAEARKKEDKTNPTFEFGMFRNRKLWDVAKSEDAKRLMGYCSWMYDTVKKGKWTGQRPSTELMDAIREYLKLPKESKLPF